MNAKYYSALKIAIIFLVISAFYIVFSDNIILQFFGDSISLETLNKIQSVKGLIFVLLTSIFLFILIYKEINSKQKHIEELESQQKILKKISEDKNELSKELSERNKYIETILDNIPLGVAVNKLNEGTAVYLNKKFEQIYGWPASELIDITNFFQKVYPNKTYRKKIKSRILDDIKSGNPENMVWEEIQITTQKDEKRIVNAQNIPLFEQNLMISTVDDVTEKVKTQKERNRIFENSIDMICTASFDGYFQSLNPAWEKILGWSEEELRSKPFLEFIHPEDVKRATTATQEIEKGNTALRFENRYATKDGDYKWLSWNTIPLPKENIMFGIARDITFRKKAEEELRQSKDLLEQSKKQLEVITNNLPGAIVQFKMSPDGSDELIYVSKGAYMIWGIDANEAMEDNQKFWKQIDSAYLEKVEKSIKTSFESLIPWHVEFKTKLPNKTAKWIEAIGIPRKLRDGSVIWDSIMLDITSRKLIEEQLQESKALLEKTINSLNEVVLVIDPENRKILLVNAAVEKMFGYKPSEVIGNNTKMLHINREKYEAFANIGEPILEEHGTFHTEFQMKHKDGSIIETENIVTSIKNENNWYSGVVSVIRDITVRKNNEKKLREYQQSLRNLTTELSLAEEKQRKEIAANIHDHLSQLLVISKIKVSDLKNDEKSEKRQLKLSSIINHISEALENSRRITYDLSPPILYEMGLVETMYWLTEKIEGENNIKVQFKTNIETIALPESTLIFMFRSIQELLYNAIKHACASSIITEFHFANNLLSVLVKDDGKGFNLLEMDKKKSATKSFGLFAVKERIKNLGGKFSIKSKEGKGTEAKIDIPIH